MNKEEKKNQNRKRMPETAAFYDLIVKTFGKPAIKWAKENGYEVGKKDA